MPHTRLCVELLARQSLPYITMAKQLGEFAKISVSLLPSARDDSRVNFSASRKIK